jgi:hypothetical protein
VYWLRVLFINFERSRYEWFRAGVKFLGELSASSRRVVMEDEASARGARRERIRAEVSDG